MMPFCGKDRMYDCTFFELNKPSMQESHKISGNFCRNQLFIMEKIMTHQRKDNLNSLIGVKWKCKLF